MCVTLFLIGFNHKIAISSVSCRDEQTDTVIELKRDVHRHEIIANLKKMTRPTSGDNR